MILQSSSQRWILLILSAAVATFFALRDRPGVVEQRGPVPPRIGPPYNSFGRLERNVKGRPELVRHGSWIFEDERGSHVGGMGGAPETAGRYLYGELDGPWTYWNDNGLVRAVRDHQGFEGGDWSLVYHPNGLLRSASELDQGERHGRVLGWTNDGSLDLDVSGLYDSGTRTGPIEGLVSNADARLILEEIVPAWDDYNGVPEVE